MTGVRRRGAALPRGILLPALLLWPPLQACGAGAGGGDPDPAGFTRAGGGAHVAAHEEEVAAHAAEAGAQGWGRDHAHDLPAVASVPEDANRGFPAPERIRSGPVGPARVLRVGPEGEFSTIGAALAAASPWDTVTVAPGVYRERLRVDRPAVLRGEGWPVVDGGGVGHVVEALAPLEISGFVLRGSGQRVDTEDAGLMVRGAPARIEGNRLEDVFFGIYLKDAPGSLIRGNAVRGKPLPFSRRGDGIRLWHSSRTRIAGNAVEETRDVVVYFSDGLSVEDNLVRGGRYGLHYMYSHHNSFRRNRFEGNQVGAFIMYSRDIELRENVFAAAEGMGGMGLGLKDSDRVRAEQNLLVGNAIGIYLDNSPTGRDVTNRFEGNLLLRNGTGVHLLPAVRGNEFRGNDFVKNRRPVAVAGGAAARQAAQNEWRGNYWTEYAGFDADGDGAGDTPFAHARLVDHLVSRHPDLQLFALSPALRLVDALSRFFPLLRPEPVAVDPAPALEPRALRRWREAPPVAPAAAAGGRDPSGPTRVGQGGTEAAERERGFPGGAAVAWAGLAGLSLTGLAAGLRLPRSRRRTAAEGAG